MAGRRLSVRAVLHVPSELQRFRHLRHPALARRGYRQWACLRSAELVPVRTVRRQPELAQCAPERCRIALPERRRARRER